MSDSLATKEDVVNCYRVNSVVLDDFLPTFPALHLLKIDIEGAEYLAFVGMTRLLQQHRPTIIMKFSPDLLQITSQVSPEQCLDYLCQLGYRLCILDDTTPDPLVNMPNEAIIGRLLKGHWGHVDLIVFPG